MAAAQAFELPAPVLKDLVLFANSIANSKDSSYQLQQQMLAIDTAYMREGNKGTAHTEAVVANAAGDKSRIQDITVPIVMPQVESGVTYLSSVFLQEVPIFGVLAPKVEQQATAAMYDVIMEENSIRGGWIRQLNMFFRDGLKYNVCGLEVDWKKVSTFTVETNVIKSATTGTPTETVWQGNTIKRLDMYNTFFDTRVAPAEVHSKGDFAGYVETYSRVALAQLLENTEGIIAANIKPAFTSKKQGKYYVPQLNSSALEAQATSSGFDWGAWVGFNSKVLKDYSSEYEVMTLYIRLIPADFNMNVPGKQKPQIWKLLIVNNAICVLAERQTNAHNYLNIIIGQPLEDGLSLQTKSFATNAMPMQDAASSLLNATLMSKRRMQFDRLLYNPQLVNEKDINSTNPVARIPVRSAAYTKSLAEAVYTFPYNDNSSNSMLQEMGLIVSFADKLQGINPAQQGQFVKGNKTEGEFGTVMSNANGRFQTMALYFEAQVFTPLKEMLKLNIMQYAQAGEIYSRQTKELVAVDPLALRTAALEFKISDGFLPAERLMNTETLQVALQVAGSSPQIAAELDIVGLFLHYLTAKGAKNMEQFRKVPPAAPLTPTEQPPQ